MRNQNVKSTRAGNLSPARNDALHIGRHSGNAKIMVGGGVAINSKLLNYVEFFTSQWVGSLE